MESIPGTESSLLAAVSDLALSQSEGAERSGQSDMGLSASLTPSSKRSREPSESDDSDEREGSDVRVPKGKGKGRERPVKSARHNVVDA